MTLWDVRLILITFEYNFQIKYCNSTQLLKILNDSLLVCSSCNQIWLRRGDLREVKQSHYLQLQTHQDHQLSSQSQLPTSRDHVWEVKIAGDCRTNKKSCEHMGMIEKHLFIYICEDKNPFSPLCLF